MLDSLPNKLWAYLFEFLDQKTFFGVATSCKKFSQIFKEHNKFWVRECLGQYFSFDLELYSEIYQNESYKVYIKNKILSLTKKLWRQHLIEGGKKKCQFVSLLSQMASEGQGEDFVKFIFQTLKEPNLPMINLKRETMVQSTRSVFQNKLSEVLYEDAASLPKKFNLIDDNSALIDMLQDKESELLQEARFNDKSQFLQARWYILEPTNNKLLDEPISLETNTDDVDLDSFNLPNLGLLSKAGSYNKNHSYLINLYDCLTNTLIHFCRLVSEFLDSLDNVYDLLAEYISRWKTFVCSMIEIEKACETFTNLFNKAYETVFEGYPSFPKFSIWRLMTKIWIREVYEKAGMSQNLNAAFLQILSNLREKNIKDSLGENKMNIEFPELKTEKLPKCLYINLQTKEKDTSPVDSLSYCHLTDNSHIYFGDSIQTQKELLLDYMQSILDISLTEVSIHYLDCSELPVNCPYKELEDSFLAKSNDFYFSYQPLFCECPEYYCNFLKSDCFLLSEILIGRTKYKFEALQLQHGLNFVKEALHNQLEYVNLEELPQQCEELPLFKTEEQEELGVFVENTIKEILETLKQKNMKKIDDFDYYRLPSLSRGQCANIQKFGAEEIEEEFNIDKNFIDQVILYINRKYITMKEDFGYLNNNIKSLEETRNHDQYVKEKNINKNIPFEIGDVDCLFYDLDKEINIPLLEKLYEDYILFVKEQGKEINLPEEDPLQLNNDHNNNGMELELDFGQEEFNEDLDLLNLDNLQLRRTLF